MAADSDDVWEMQQMSHRAAEDAADFKARARAFGLGPWELSIFEAIRYDYGQVRDVEQLERYAYGSYQKLDPEEAKRRTERCFQEDWIQRLDRAFLDARRAELESGGYLMLRGLIGSDSEERGEDLVGLISFTVPGAELYLSFCGETADSDHWAMGSCADDATATDVYGTSIEQCFETISFESTPVLHGEPIPVGRWCDRWWRTFERGFRMRCWLPDHADP